MRVKKKYGQHFLKNPANSNKITKLIDNYQKVRNVLEVGPGRGALTAFLTKKDIHLKCIEIDNEAVQYLIDKRILEENQIIAMNFLDLDLNQVFGGENFILIGNFPYNISSQIVISMVENKAHIPVMIGMFQKEVADRLISSPGSKKYGRLSVITQRHYTGRCIMTLGPSDFYPQPKVDSGVVVLERREVVAELDEKKFQAIVKAAFSQRRKMLRNSLKTWINSENKDWAIWTRRPEQLSVSEFEQLVQALS